MNNNTINPIPEELHVYSHDEGTENGTTPSRGRMIGWEGYLFATKIAGLTPLDWSVGIAFSTKIAGLTPLNSSKVRCQQ